MPQTTPEQFAKAIATSGLLSADDLKKLWGSLPSETRPKDGEAFARLLMERQLLTGFQAQILLRGSKTPLVLGDYVLIGKIGAGGMGQVFKAQHRHMKRLVAIKLLSEALTSDEAAVKRFQREVEAAAKLSHPHIVHAHDASVQRGVWYLVMEYVAGSDLASRVRSDGPLSVSRAVHCIRQAAEGLAYAHRQGVIHRDIKPGNLLLEDNGELKILDMGLARLDASVPHQDELTGTGQIMGTIDYMAPEQALNTKHADARADIYSLGVTLWYLLTGRAVYDGDTVIEKLLAHREQPIPSLTAVCPGVSPALDQVFRRMIAKKADERYQTMQDVLAALGACPHVSDPEPTTNLPAINVPASAQPFASGARGVSSGAAVLMTPVAKLSFTDMPETIDSGTLASDTSPSAQPHISAIQVSTSKRNRAAWWRDWRVLSGTVLVGIATAAFGLNVAINGVGRASRPTTASAADQRTMAANMPTTGVQLSESVVQTGSIEGQWFFDRGSLVSPTAPFAQFRWPGKAASRYCWKFDVTREAGQGPLIVGLPAGSTVVVATLDDGSTHKCEWGEKTSVQPSRSVTTTDFTGFGRDKAVRVECHVSDTEWRVTANGTEVLRHTGPGSGYAPLAHWQLADYGSGFLATSLTKFRFKNIDFHNLSAEH